MKKVLPFFILLLSISACKEKSPSSNIDVCGVKDPARNLPWLRDLITQAKADKQDKMLTISVVELRGEPVINYSLLSMSCIGCISYRCDGTRVDMSKYEEEELTDYRNNLWSDKGKRIVIWPEK